MSLLLLFSQGPEGPPVIPDASCPGPAFVVEVLSSTGMLLGSGPIANVLQVDVESTLDAAGQVSISVPATDPHALALLQPERRIRVRTLAGDLVTGIIRTKTTTPGEAPAYTVSGPDLMDELTRLSCGRARIYDNVPVSMVVPDLLAGFSPTWSATVDAVGTITARFDGDTRLGALQALRQRLEVHFRHSTTPRTLEFGAFGVDSGVRLMNVAAFTVGVEDTAIVALAAELECVEDSWSVVNKVFALGAGDGEGQLDLRYCTYPRSLNILIREGPRRGITSNAVGTTGDMSITVDTTTGFVAGDTVFIGDRDNLSIDHEINQVAAVSDGTHLALTGPLQHDYPDNYVLAWPEFYIWDYVSVGAYGSVERPVVWKEIAPLTNSDADLVAAANALYDVAAAYLARYAYPLTVYRASALTLPTSIQVGDKIRLVYKGRVLRDGVTYSWLDVNALMWVLKIKRTLRPDGSTLVSLDVANLDRLPLSESDPVVGAITAGEVWKSYTQAYPCRFENTRWEDMDSTHPATVPVDIDDSVLYLGKARVRFRTRPFRATASGMAAGGGDLVTSSADGGELVTSASGGSQTPTSAAGGADTVTSGGSAHRHVLATAPGGDYTDTNKSFDVNANPSGTGGSWEITQVQFRLHDSTHDYQRLATFNDDPAHSHDVDIEDHTHSVAIAAHDHSVTTDDHTHDVDVASHTHALSYGIHDDTLYPVSISLKIDGTDQTTRLGGPWAVGGGAADIELDLTQFLRNAAGGLRQVHSLVFSCASGQGTLESIVKLLTTVQSIVVL